MREAIINKKNDELWSFSLVEIYIYETVKITENLWIYPSTFQEKWLSFILFTNRR